MQQTDNIAQELLKDREKGSARFMAEYRERLYSVALALCHDETEAEDLVLRTLERILEKIGDYQERDSFYNWACVIMVNLYRDSTRGKMVQGTVPVGGAAEMDALMEPVGAERIVMDVDSGIVRQVLDRMPEDMREVLLLHYFMDMPVGKIAKFLTMPVGSIKSRLHYARLALAMRLGVKLKKPAIALVAAALFLLASAAAVVGLRGAEAENQDVEAVNQGVEAANQGAEAANQGNGGSVSTLAILEISNQSNSTSTREKTTMNETIIGGLLRKAAGGIKTFAMMALTASVANAADPYVESDGTAGLNMGYIMKPNSRLEVDFSVTELGDNTKNKRVFGADAVGSGMTYSLYLPNDNSYLAFYIGDGTSISQYWSSVRATVGGRHTAVFDIFHDRIALLTGSVTNWNRATGHSSFPIDCKRSLTLFGDTASSGAYGFIRTLPARIYGVKIYESDILVHDYEPCEKDGMRGYKDRVGGGLVTAVNETYYGSLTLGGDYTKYTSPYVATPENNTDTYIATGYQIISNTCVVLDCALISDWTYTTNPNNGYGTGNLFGATGGNDDAAAGNYNRFQAFLRHIEGFGVQTYNNAAGWLHSVIPSSALTNGNGGVFRDRRSYGLDTMVGSSGYGRAFVERAGKTIGNTNRVHALRLTKPGATPLHLATSYNGATGAKTSLKIYGCRIAESGATVCDYVPAFVNGVAGLQDQMPGGGFVGAAAGTLTLGGFVPTVTASAAKISSSQRVSLTASAPGAVSYRWFRNGESISGGENGTLEVAWRKSREIDTYRAVSLSVCAGETLTSELSASVALENLPKGTAIILR